MKKVDVTYFLFFTDYLKNGVCFYRMAKIIEMHKYTTVLGMLAGYVCAFLIFLFNFPIQICI